MKLYVDSEHKIHTTNLDGIFRKVETDFFSNDKCVAYIEGYCYDDSKDYVQIYPWRPYSELDAVQREYEKQKLTEYNAVLQELGVET